MAKGKEVSFNWGHKGFSPRWKCALIDQGQLNYVWILASHTHTHPHAHTVTRTHPHMQKSINSKVVAASAAKGERNVSGCSSRWRLVMVGSREVLILHPPAAVETPTSSFKLPKSWWQMQMIFNRFFSLLRFPGRFFHKRLRSSRIAQKVF